MKPIYLNPDGSDEDQEYLVPGDILAVTANMEIYTFQLPSARSDEYRSIIVVQEGDILEYIGVDLRDNYPFGRTALYRFKLVVLDQYGDQVSEKEFYVKNVESILKWSERID